jgi:hypothetical protein
MATITQISPMALAGRSGVIQQYRDRDPNLRTSANYGLRRQA